MKTFLIYAAIIVVFATMFHSFKNDSSKPEKITFSQFVHSVEAGDVKEVTFMNGGDISGEYAKHDKGFVYFTTTGDTTNPEVFKILMAHNIVPNYQYEKSSIWTQVLFMLLPVVIIMVFFAYMMKGQAAPANKMGQFGKANPALVKFDGLVSFADVAGNEEAKEDLKEVVDYLKNPDKYVKMGAKIPKGVLMEGPPGTGKTLLAKATAGEAGVNFFTTSGSEFVEMFVGVGASRVRDLFAIGKKNAPCIIFIDEIDAIGAKRGISASGHDERGQTLNQILVEMDGFTTSTGVIIMAATNRADVLDPALVRAGRFDRKLTISNPDMKSRKAILEVHAKGKPIDSSVDLEVVARGTPGFSGADLANLINEATLLAVRNNKAIVTSTEFESARDKILMGTERRTLKFSQEELKSTSVHECGHALVNKFLAGLDPLHKITIVPRGNALGLTQTLPIDDKVTLSKDKAEKTISFLMGGRAAEELVYNQVTSGARNDISRATKLAEKMVCELGMSDLGPIEMKRTCPKARKEVEKIIAKQYEVAKEVLTKNIDILHKLSDELFLKETLSGEEIDAIIKG